MCKKLIPFILVLAMLLSIVPAVTAEEQQAPQFTTRSLSLSKSIAINFKVPYDDVKNSFSKVVFIKDGESVQEIDSLPTEDSKGMAVFTFSELSPLDLGKEITARLYYTDENYTEVKTSVLDYCNAVLRNPENTTELKTLVVDLLNYGAAFQTYRDVTTELVNESLTDEQKAMGTQTEPELNSCLAIGEEMADPSVTWEEASVILEDSVTMSFKVRANEVAGMRMKVTCNGSSWIITEFESLNEPDVYKLYFDKLNPAQMRDKIEAVICDAAGNPISNTLTFSIESYAAYQVENATDEDLVALVKAMMRYGGSAAVWANDTSSAITRADIETALAEVAWDYYMKDVWIQYDSMDLNTRVDGNNQPLSRWYSGHTRLDTYLNVLEDANSDNTMYTVCSYYPWAVYYEVLNYPLFGNSLNASTLDIWYYSEKPDDMLIARWHKWDEGTWLSDENSELMTHNKCLTYEELCEFLRNWDTNLRAGDIIYVPGHVVIYVGNGYILEATGKKYDMSSGLDMLENDGSIDAYTVEDYFFNYETSGSTHYLEKYYQQSDGKVCIVRPLDLLTVDDGDGNLENDVLDDSYELDLGCLNLQFSGDPNNILKTSGYTIQDSAYSRMEYPAMNIDRTVNITPYGTAAKDENITYTVSISNESNNAAYMAYQSYGSDTAYTGTDYVGLQIKETVPENTVLVSASEGAQIAGNTLLWNVDIAAGETLAVSYTVKVTGEIGETIVNDGGMVANIPSNSISNRIGGKKVGNAALEKMQEFFAAGKNQWNSNEGYKISAAANQSTRFAERIYNETVGVDLQLPDVQELLNILFSQTLVEEEHGMYLQYSNGKISRYMYTLNDTTEDSANQIYRDMVVDGYYGGVWVYSNTYAGDPRIDELRTDYLEPGDIMIYVNLDASASGGAAEENRNVTEWQTMVYLGDYRFASLDNTGRMQALQGANTVSTAFIYDMFVTLRPSQAYTDISTNVEPFVGPAEDLTAEDEALKYVPNVSNVLLNESMSAKLAEMTPNDGWAKQNIVFAIEVYTKLGLAESDISIWNNSYANLVKAAFADIPSDSEAYNAFTHEYHLLDEPAAGTEMMYDIILHYDGRAFITKNPIPSMENLHPGDVILLGSRIDRHYVTAVYQGNGKFLTARQSLTGGRFTTENSYDSVSFTSDAAFLAWLNGPIDASQYPDIYFEGYLVLRPSRLYENINTMVVRDITEGPLTTDEKAALSALTPEEWPGNLANLKNAAPWVYNAAGINVSGVIKDTIKNVRNMIFSGEDTNITLIEGNTSDYAKMLIEGYYGSSGGTKHAQFTAADFEIGDVFCATGTCNGCNKTYYMTAVYQGNGRFLSVVNCTGEEVLSCGYDTTTVFAEDFFSQTSVATWKYYFVLRPSKLAEPQVEEPTEPRDISTGVLTEAEKAALSALTPEEWPGDLANLKNAAPWVYNAAGVNVSGVIKDTIKNVRNMIFSGEDTNITLIEGNTSDYAKMLIEGYYGSSGGTKHAQFTAADFEIGDIFCATGKCLSCKKTYYMTAVYQGNGRFLSVVNCTGNEILDCNYDTTTVFAEDFFAQNSVATWKYYFVLRPDQINNAS